MLKFVLGSRCDFDFISTHNNIVTCFNHPTYMSIYGVTEATAINGVFFNSFCIYWLLIVVQ